MIEIVVSRSEPITLIGAGVVTDADIIDALKLAPTLVAADGGANLAVESGTVPSAVIGDLDSIKADVRARIPAERIFAIDEQDDTDFEKALLRIDAPLVVAIGFCGGRLDHQLAALHSLVRFSGTHVILVSEHDIVCHTPPDLSVPVEPGTPVSLFPMRDVSGRSTGLRWPIDGLRLAPGGRIGTSNIATETEFGIAVDGPGLLTILPRRMLGDLARSLGRCAAWTADQPVPA